MRTLVLAAAVLASATGAAAPVAAAGTVLDRVRSSGVVHCGGAIRPGLAFPTTDMTWHGAEVELCRAVAVAAIGPNGRAAFRPYTAAPHGFDAVRDGTDDVFFLTMPELLDEELLAQVQPGPTVYVIATGALVFDKSPVRSPADLVGHRVCAEPGTPAHRNVENWFTARHLTLSFFPFFESDEMLDAFSGGQCEAVVHEMPALAAIALNAAHDGHPSRILPQPIAATPLLADTPPSDPAWSRLVSLTVFAVQASEQETDEDGQHTILEAEGLGLRAGWQGDVRNAVGTYAGMLARTLGDGSPLHVPRGLSATWDDGGVLTPPRAE